MAKRETLKQMEKRHAKEKADLVARCPHRGAKWIPNKSEGYGAEDRYCEKCNTIIDHHEGHKPKLMPMRFYRTDNP
jgi:hypothetical protein